jgi:hypothetical protein
MSREFLLHNWALLAASVLGTAIVLFVAYRLLMESAGARLQAALKKLRTCERRARRARSRTARTARRLERLRGRADSVKPRLLRENAEALEDARAMQKIHDDQVLVARNLLRKIIFEEYPPKRHEAMRRRYLGSTAVETAPFTMRG